MTNALITTFAHGRLSFVMRTMIKTKYWIQTHTDTLGPAALRSIPVSDTPHASLACSVWANQEMAHCFFFSSLQHELKEEQGRNKWLKWGEKMLNVWEEERDQTTYYSDASLLTVRQTGERCHTRWTNRRQRNGATYDINAGMGWELPAWGSFPMSRHTAWAHSETATQKHNPHALQSTFGSMCTSQNIFVHSHLHYVYLQNLDAHILKNICSWWLQENISPHWQRAVYCS